MVSYEKSAVSQASPEAVFTTWTNVEGWTAMEQIQSASIDGDFRSGAVIRSKVKGWPASRLTVTRVERPAIWVDESRVAGLRMTFEHVITPAADGTKVTERIIIAGPLAGIVGPLLRRKFESLFAASTQHMASQASQ